VRQSPHHDEAALLEEAKRHSQRLLALLLNHRADLARPSSISPDVQAEGEAVFDAAAQAARRVQQALDQASQRPGLSSEIQP